MERQKAPCFLVGNVGSENAIILQYWNAFKSCWNTFQAFRTAPGEFTTSGGRTGKFAEKPLSHEEAKAHEKIEIVPAAASMEWRDCQASRTLAGILKAQIIAGTMTKETAQSILKEQFPLKKRPDEEKDSPFDGIL